MDGSGNVYIADEDNHRIKKLDISKNSITTMAGTGIAGYNGDGGPATSAQLDNPMGIYVDGSGNIYIADTFNCLIRKVDAVTGNISTVAGMDGQCGYDDDNKPATSAMLNYPMEVFVDTLGNIYIADRNNNRIRKVDTSGIITTVAGTGTAGYNGDGGPATSAMLKYPRDVFVDTSGDIYIADEYNIRIRKVDTSGIITTVAGTGTAGYSGDGGPATSAMLKYPRGVCVDTNGSFFIADACNHRLRVVSAHDGKINTIAGTGSAGFNGDNQPATDGTLNYPEGVAMASTRGGHKIYISDTENNRIRVLTFKPVKEL